MRILPAAALALLVSVALCSPLSAQTTATYQAPTGSVSPSLVVTMTLTGGGKALLSPVVGPNCYLGMTCAFPSGYVGTYMSYTLPDGSTANLPNFSGTFSPSGNNRYEINGQASGTDSQSRNVSVDTVQVTMQITCRSGRGGGCSKVYTGGTLTVTLNGTPPTSGPTATSTPTGVPTVTPTPTMPAPLALRFVGLKPSGATSANGAAVLTGSFVMPAAGTFDASEGLTLNAQATGFDAGYTWDASQCQAVGAIIRCVSSDKHDKLIIGAGNTPPGIRTFMARFRNLEATGPFAGPVTATLTDESMGISYSGTIATCHAQGVVLVCK
ncbi:MAG: hypothetical protein ACHQ9S_05630 [Candidatus Binatia bacterium]